MYQGMRALHDADSKLDALSRQATQIQDHENRMRILERGRCPMPTIGVLAGVAGAATGAVALFTR